MNTYIAGFVVIAINAGITSVIAGVVNRWLKKRDDETKEIIAAIRIVSEKVDALKSEFAVYQLTAMEKYASKDETVQHKNENTQAHKELWGEINDLKNKLTETQTMVSILQQQKRGMP